MLLLTLVMLLVCCIYSGIAQEVPACRIQYTCDCCRSNPDGTRELVDICEDQRSGWRCTYGCMDGYFSVKCWNVCPKYCTRCARDFGDNRNTNYQICYLCADGYYNGTRITNCSTPCPANCAQNQCDKSTGNCLLGCTSSNWSGDKCNVCAATWYGNNCDIRCPETCKERICNRNGECITCADENLDGLQCDQCKDGKFGANCDKDCPINCMYDTCQIDDGGCTSGCKGNFVGDKCDKCKSGYYGENCDNHCSNCLNGMCDRSTGRCIKCVIDKFGEQCDKFCATGCENLVCDRHTSVCSQGCRPGYSGDKCCVIYNNCEICESTTSCSKCKSGFYGDSCGESCPSNCAGACDKETGNCVACKEIKYYGDKCDTPCPTTSLKGQCAQEDGRCISCKVAYFGSLCEDKCPENCLDGECSRELGHCISCKTGYFGQTCTKTCPTNCEDNICGQNNGACNNCIAGFHGYVCDIECKRQDCINNTCSQTTGLCALGCINGCEEEPQPSCYTGEIIGGIIAAFVIIIALNNVIWLVWTRRHTKDNKKDPGIHANAIYENDQADPDGYEELRIPRH